MEAAERQLGSFEETWGDEEGAESSLHGRLEACEERRRDEEGRRVAYKGN